MNKPIHCRNCDAVVGSALVHYDDNLGCWQCKPTTMRFNKAAHPTSKPVAEAIECLRDALFREYGPDFSFSVLGRGEVIGASVCNTTLHAVIKE